MIVSQPTTNAEPSLGRAVLNAARYYLGNRRGLLIVSAAVLLAGIGLNWGWLVAAGIAPILLSTLPCLVMCGLGLCMMGRSCEKQSAPSADVKDAVASSGALGANKMNDERSGANWRQGQAETQAQVTQQQTINERSESHA
jgi:hypothetical protein